MSIVFGSGGVSIRGYSLAEDYDISVQTTMVSVSSGDPQPSQWNELLYTKIFEQHVERQHQLTLTGSAPEAVLESLTPSVCSTEGLLVRSVATDTGRVLIKTRYGDKLQSYACQVTLGASYYETLQGYALGSLAAAWWSTIRNELSGKTASAARQNQWQTAEYSTNPALCTATPNTNRIFKDIDLSAISFCRAGSYLFQATLVTPRHVLMSEHTGQAGPVIFRDNAGVFHSRNITAVYDIGDLRLALLSGPITAIQPMQVLPLDIREYATMITGPQIPDDNLEYPPPSGYRRINVPPPLIRGWYREGSYDYLVDTPVEWPVITRRANVGKAPGDNASIALAGAYGKLRVNMLQHTGKGGAGFSMRCPIGEFATWGSWAYGGDSGSVTMLMTPIHGEIVPLYVGPTFQAGMGVESGVSLAGHEAELVTQMRLMAAAVGDSTLYDFRYADLSEYPKINTSFLP